MTPATVPCPCCGDPMDGHSVVCPLCYAGTKKLRPGYWEADAGFWVTVTETDVERWTRELHQREQAAQRAEEHS